MIVARTDGAECQPADNLRWRRPWPRSGPYAKLSVLILTPAIRLPPDSEPALMSWADADVCPAETSRNQGRDWCVPAPTVEVARCDPAGEPPPALSLVKKSPPETA